MTNKTTPLKSTYQSEYGAWLNANHRCRNPKHKAYKDYGSRGITVYEGWHTDFWAFLAYIGPKPSPELTLERVDNEKGYEPGNVKWASRLEQAHNRRVPARFPRYQYGEELLTLGELSKRTGIARPTLTSRLAKGLTGEALVAPPFVHPNSKRARVSK